MIDALSMPRNELVDGLLAIPSLGPEPTDFADERFGRCTWIVFHDPGTGAWSAEKRDPDTFESGAGRATASFLARRGVSLVLAGKVGPKAAKALDDAGLAWREGCSGTCEAIVAAWREGR